ncbi:MAG: PD40 domain-containing protein [Bacteroidetes bacterium]|nr:PD40 domain-containing protein [Bacteroidota bacterium]
MKKYFLLSFSLLSLSLFAGGDEKNKSPMPSPANTLVDNGNKLLTKGEFSAAIAIWTEVLRQDVENANANFKMGMCYYNSIDESPKALPFLKKAAKNISDKYDFFSSTEKNAPYDVLYFLGETYLTADQPDSALWMFFQYEDKFGGFPPIPVDRQIRNCINAKNSKKNPRDVTMKNPGKNVNTTFAETNPVITIDNSVMFFASRKATKEQNKQVSNVNGKYDMDIYYTHKDASGKWDPAIAFKWNTDKDEAPLYISPDGLTFYFCKMVNGQSDVYMSNYVDKVWSNPKPIAEINSPSNETGLSISADGKYLYFSSDRAGGNGKFDIYQCVKTGAKWGAPVNLGTALNTGFSEISPYINPNGKTLFFSSNGYRDGMGGYDIFYSELKDNGTWSKPANMGFPINTTRDDINFYITGGGTRYYSTVRDNANSFDIFKIEGGGFAVENIESGGMVTLTQEMNVSDVVEVQKTVEKEVEVVETVETTVEVIKEVEKIDVEKDKMKMDSMMVLAKKEAQLEKQQLELEKAKYEAQKVQARADSVKAIADIKMAEANKAKADAEAKKSDADKAKANADEAKSEAAKSASDAAKAKSDAMIAAAQKAKDDAAAAKANADAKMADANKAKADAALAQAEATKVKAEADKLKAQESAAKAISDKAVAEQKTLELKNQLAEAEKPKNEAMKAKAEADKAKAEADKLKAQETIAAANKSKSDAVIASAEKAKADADAKKSQADIANAEKAKADAAKADATAKTTQATAEKAKADADKIKAQADIANSAKAQADATKADAAAKTAQAVADTKKADADKLKAQADIANSAKAQADAAKADAVAKTAQAAADKAKADADAKKADAEKLKAQADISAGEKAKADAAKAEANAKTAQANADKAKSDAEAKKAQLEILKLNPPKTGGAKPNPANEK